MNRWHGPEVFTKGAAAWRVAVVTETWPPEINGVATSLEQLVEALLAAGHRINLVRPRQRPGEVGMLTARLHELLTASVPIPLYRQLRMGLPCARVLEQRWRERRPDLVHIATEGPLGWSARRAALRLGLPLVADFRTNFHSYARHYGVGAMARPVLAALRRFHNRCHATMVPTEALRRELEAQGFERLHVVGRGVDTRRFDPARRCEALRRSWGADASTLVVSCVGRLAPEKNLELVLRGFEAIRQRQPRARLVFVGDGPMREALTRRCPQAIFAGHRRGDDLAAHYASADLFLFASLTETFGNVTTEAMASGLPVLAFDHAAAGQLIRSGYDGVLADRADDAAFVSAACALAGDAPLRAALARQARATACRIGWAQVAAQFESVALHAMAAAAGQALQRAGVARAFRDTEAGVAALTESR